MEPARCRLGTDGFRPRDGLGVQARLVQPLRIPRFLPPHLARLASPPQVPNPVII